MVMRDVSITPVLNGFIVHVGCQTLVFDQIEKVADNLIAYQKDPEGIEKKFIAAAVNKTMEVNPPQPMPVRGNGRLRPIDDEVCCETQEPTTGG